MKRFLVQLGVGAGVSAVLLAALFAAASGHQVNVRVRIVLVSWSIVEALLVPLYCAAAASVASLRPRERAWLSASFLAGTVLAGLLFALLADRGALPILLLFTLQLASYGFLAFCATCLVLGLLGGRGAPRAAGIVSLLICFLYFSPFWARGAARVAEACSLPPSRMVSLAIKPSPFVLASTAWLRSPPVVFSPATHGLLYTLGPGTDYAYTLPSPLLSIVVALLLGTLALTASCALQRWSPRRESVERTTTP